jgi:hypothetical protein
MFQARERYGRRIGLSIAKVAIFMVTINCSAAAMIELTQGVQPNIAFVTCTADPTQL